MELVLASFAVAWVAMHLFGSAGRCPLCRGKIPKKDATICMHCGSAIHMDESRA